MKNIYLTVAFSIAAHITFAQASGNVNYNKQIQAQTKIPDSNINISVNTSADLTFSVKGLSNVRPDAYVAIFNLNQVGKTTEEVSTLMDQRINSALSELSKKLTLETVVDMVSFVPVYEIEVEKKLFNKKTYNEVPAGFEVQKNIHIKFTKLNDLNLIIAVMAMNEIYELVRVDCFANNLDGVKKELQTKAQNMLKEKFKNYQLLLGEKLENSRQQLGDGFKVVLPIEMYKSYTAYKSTSLNLRKSEQIKESDKSQVLYYQPVLDKEFDFVVNPTVLEPVIQVMYEVKLMVTRDKTPQPIVEAPKPVPTKEYFLITPSGDVKNLNIGK